MDHAGETGKTAPFWLHDDLFDFPGYDSLKRWAQLFAVPPRNFAPQTEPKLDKLGCFVFPGASVFTYKNARFSKGGDLLCDVSYLDPNETEYSTWIRPRAKKTKTPRFSLQGSYSSVLNLSYTTELMENYVAGKMYYPPKNTLGVVSKFEALQDDLGNTLLFSIHQDGSLHVMKEESGVGTGWKDYDISTATIQREVPGGEVRTFDVAQNPLDGSIGLMMAVRSGDTDHLFTSLINSAAEMDWILDPEWDLVDVDKPSGPVTIRNAFFAATSGTKQYLIVDADRAGEMQAGVRLLERYHIRHADLAWVKHPLPIDVESSEYQSCIGMVSGGTASAPKKGRVDGLYTMGVNGSATQLVYVPIINPYSKYTEPEVTTLKLPGGPIKCSAIATARWVQDDTDPLFGSTYLFAIAGSALYYWDNKAQKSPSGVGTYLLEDVAFKGTTTLLADSRDGVTTIWGKTMYSGSGILAVLGSIIKPAEAELPPDSPLSYANTILSSLGGAMKYTGGFLVPRKPLKNSVVDQLSSALSLITVAAPLALSGKLLSSGLNIPLFGAPVDKRAAAAIIDAILVLPAVLITGYHFYELSQEAASTDRTGAIMGEVTNIAGFVARVAYAGAINDKDEESKQIFILILGGSNYVIAGLNQASALVAIEASKDAANSVVTYSSKKRLSGFVKEVW
ncbi:hypothetical protein TGAMA5MH_05184 [Trichoderma gamsii]|uniref:Uncharacterized protein n=1 Tax=Trichoderma gamsii TaxID=398673 RepID=A0A2K0TAA0_9HYPO|nr:hypothetical protein TGAMA5MH_05184 [Trichoderma gamsii]